MISGSSSGSFEHNVAATIERLKRRACECGSTDVYVQSQEERPYGTASVTLVAFRNPRRPAEDAERQRRCRAKGGTWNNGACQVPVD